MERKIIIVDSASNSQTTITTDATTFGQLKAAVRAAGINIDGKDWLEGLTKTQPMSDDALLPTNVNYKGQVTNNLVYMLTNTNKKTRSGAMSYNEMKSYIKNNGLTAEFQEKYGKNYTQGKTTEFQEFIAAHSASTSQPAKPAEKPAEAPKAEQTVEATKTQAPTAEGNTNVDYKERYESMVYAIACFFSAIDDEMGADINKVLEEITKKEEQTTPVDMEFSGSDINSMFAGIRK